ncbi:hypothetical protein WJX79_010663 [Trebouxia sp. C0005]
MSLTSWLRVHSWLAVSTAPVLVSLQDGAEQQIEHSSATSNSKLHLGKPAKTPTAEDGPRPGTAPRTVRPRQLHVNDKMRIVVGTDDPDIAGIDGGAFLEYLQRQEEEAQPGANSVKLSAVQPRVAVIGHTFKPIPASLEAPELSVLGKPLPAVRQEAASAIATPSYTNIQSSLVQENAKGGKSAYIRYVVPTPDDEEATVEYDLDEEDEEWLQHHCQGKAKMSEDDMEQLMDALEKMHHTELQKHPERWANLIGSPLPAKDGRGKGKASGDGLQLPGVDTVLPLQTALQGLSSQPAAAIKAVYLHWCQKRQYSERPLLQRLWYEPPWHRLTVAGSKGKAKTEGESEDDVPFMAQEERRPLNRARRTMQLQDVDSKLRDMRDDLEQLTRGVADEAAKLHHVKIIRAHSGQPGSSNGAAGPSEEAVPSGEGNSVTQQQSSPVTGAHDVAAGASAESTHAHPDSQIPQAPLNKPQALSEAQCESGDEASRSTRTMRSGRLFAAKPDPPLPPNASESADTVAASEPVPGEAARAAAARGSLSQPWERPLLGVGLSLGLPEEARWADQGRPSTDHPRHKTKSATMMRRTLSPPLSSPRPLPPQPSQPPPSNCPQDLPGPSQPCTQLPSQLPASQSQSTRVTVDRGCDPIVFSDDSGSDREPEEAGGAAAGQKCKRPATRQQESARKAHKRAVSETPSEVTQRVTRHAANQSADHIHMSTTAVDSTRASARVVGITRPSTKGLLAAIHASPIDAARTHTYSMPDFSTSAADQGRLQPLPSGEAAARTQQSAKRKRGNDEVAPAMPAAQGLESAAPSGQAAGIAVPAGRPKQHGANINASSARSAANRIAKSLVINAMLDLRGFVLRVDKCL